MRRDPAPLACLRSIPPPPLIVYFALSTIVHNDHPSFYHRANDIVMRKVNFLPNKGSSLKIGQIKGIRENEIDAVLVIHEDFADYFQGWQWDHSASSLHDVTLRLILSYNQ